MVILDFYSVVLGGIGSRNWSVELAILVGNLASHSSQRIDLLAYIDSELLVWWLASIRILIRAV